MSRKKFLQDLQDVADNPPPHVADIQRYEGDGVSFTCLYSQYNLNRQMQLKLILTNIDNYPFENSYIFFTDENEVDQQFSNVIEQISPIVDNLDIRSALSEVSNALYQSLCTATYPDQTISPDGNSIVYQNTRIEAVKQSLESSGSGDDSEDNTDDFDDLECDSDGGFGFDDGYVPRLAIFQKKIAASGTLDLRKMRSDLRAVKRAGFKVGIVGNMESVGILCVSIRVAKLGISEEAMRAWSVPKTHYLVLLIRFSDGYRDLAHVLENSNSVGKVDMRVGLCETYKPRTEDVQDVFVRAEVGTQSQSTSTTSKVAARGRLESLFIGKPLNDLLRDRFAKIVTFRIKTGMNWTGAEQLYNDTQGALVLDDQHIAAYAELEDDTSQRALPSVVLSDSLKNEPTEKASLPLVAAQFLLRHFVRCTEFCLVCHCKLEATFEALKPYVCTKPLCLYQLLAFGFGPPVEYEIISQPYVIDLLISLCCVQAHASQLKEMPLGLGLKVPYLRTYHNSSSNIFPARRAVGVPDVPQPGKEPPLDTNPSFCGRYNPQQMTLDIEDASLEKSTQLRNGEWIAVEIEDLQFWHFRIRDMIGLKLYLSDPCGKRLNADNQTVEIDVTCFLHDRMFDELPGTIQHGAVRAMLQCVPSIKELRSELLRQQENHGEPSLNMVKTIPSASRDILRWVIASNRSCIMQVDKVDPNATDAANLEAFEPRVTGMDDWVQFRFAQGAPDKEQRFVDCVQEHSANADHRTLFAWHGSPLHNWHSIIRQGLNFDTVLHGRASGHGVYMSSHLGTSLGYCGAYGPTAIGNWCHSDLNVSQVVSLQEVVNAPASFVSRAPHFVVAQKEWIQTRYLFVKSVTPHSRGNAPLVAYKQDPDFQVRGQRNDAIVIPITALSKARRASSTLQSPSNPKKQRLSAQFEVNGVDDEDDDGGASVATLEEDMCFFELDSYSDTEMGFITSEHSATQSIFTDRSKQALTAPSLPGRTRKRGIEDVKYILDQTKTDFVPGQLDTTKIKFLPPPSDAIPVATKALMKAFQAALHAQETVPLHELGFYIDPDPIENMYQWIVELHSFESSLPLAQDMRNAGITSVVLEMRFTNDFPFSPPFVRVVKPRFLPFLQGGGGHVTEGGAICMELLTSNGWSAVSSIESVLLQVKLALSVPERPARLATKAGHRFGTTGGSQKVYDTSCYGIGEAVTAFKRACAKHGWTEPSGIDAFTKQG